MTGEIVPLTIVTDNGLAFKSADLVLFVAGHVRPPALTRTAPVRTVSPMSPISPAHDPQVHRAAVERARAERELRLREPTGWLSLVELHWLHAGEQRLGAAATNEIVLTAADGDLPPVAGVLAVADGRVLVPPVAGVR